MSALRPPRWTSGRSRPGRASLSRWAQGSQSLRPMHSAEPTRNRRPTRPLRAMSRVTTFRRASAQGSSISSRTLGLDERQLVPAARTAERASPGRVAVTFETASCDGGDFLDRGEGRLRLWCDQDRRHRAFAGDSAPRRVRGEVEVERREHPAGLDPSLGIGPAGIEPRPGRRAEHNDGVVSVRSAHSRQPLAGPREVRRVLDGNEPEIALAQPLLEKEQRLALGDRRRRAEHLGDASAELVVERGHARILRGPRQPVSAASATER